MRLSNFLKETKPKISIQELADELERPMSYIGVWTAINRAEERGYNPNIAFFKATRRILQKRQDRLAEGIEGVDEQLETLESIAKARKSIQEARKEGKIKKKGKK